MFLLLRRGCRRILLTAISDILHFIILLILLKCNKWHIILLILLKCNKWHFKCSNWHYITLLAARSDVPPSGNGAFIHFEATRGREGREARHVKQQRRKAKEDQLCEEELSEAYLQSPCRGTSTAWRNGTPMPHPHVYSTYSCLCVYSCLDARIHAYI